MTMFILLITFLIFCSNSHAEVYSSEPEIVNQPLPITGTKVLSSTGNANEYLDHVLKNLSPVIVQKRLDPLKLPDFRKSFEKKVGLIRFRGGFQVTGNYLRGLKTLHRSGDATLSFDENVMKIQASLGINNLHISGNARAWFGAIRKEFAISGSVDYVSATAVLEMPMSEEGKPQASRLQIDQIGKIKIEVKNLGAINWVVEGLGNLILNTVKGILKDKISAPLLKLVNGSLDKFPDFGL